MEEFLAVILISYKTRALSTLLKKQVVILLVVLKRLKKLWKALHRIT
uniref:Uncharacterized protein n=1 Tax=Siphoviridae sp. ctWhx86 TaxID=2826362 RepID=A0A8S5QP88_9CAUD|nr:MAG TPA: hypothetical protein [Siphoviridae sp. ctWhx86]